MLKSPTKTHRLHKFRHKDSLYITDLDRFQLVEVNQIAWDAVELAPTLETEALIVHLSQTYPRGLVIETLELLGDFQSKGAIFYPPSWTPPPDSKSDRLRIYVPQGKDEWFSDPEAISAGTNVALYHTTSSSSTLNLRDIFSFVVGQFIARSCVIDVR
ncbi:MAG: hypothetical protein OXG88_04345 [Gammaproteobacteria bacterium]|nr:hypothetical protein [Gammaproteobacteria bacterium]